MTAWRQLPLSMVPADQQLAAADAMLAGLASHARPALRWYAVDAPALVLGTGQPPTAADLAACRAAGVTVHRRSSGGTAVLLEPGFVMVDVAVPREHHLYLSDVTLSYRWLGEVWVAALRAFDLAAQSIPIAEARADTQELDRLTRQACFGGRSPFEVRVGPRKVVGLSQVRRRHGALLQAGLYRNWSAQRLAHLLAMPDGDRALFTERLTARVAGLADLLPEPPDMAAIQTAFAQALSALHGVTLEASPWSAEEQVARAAALARYAPDQ